MGTHRAGMHRLALVFIAVVAVACEAVSTGSPASSPATPMTAIPAVTAVPTSAAASSPSTASDTLSAEVAAANTTPWPVAAIEAGSEICAIRVDHRLACWGGPASTPPADDVIVVAEGGAGSCAIRADRSVVCWGDAPSDTPPGEFVALSIGNNERCALTGDGVAVCWPTDPMSIVGDDGKPQPTPGPPAEQFREIEVSDLAGPCGLTTEGSVVCWALDDSPGTVAAGPYISLGAGCGVLRTGELDCFLSMGEGPPPVLPAGPFLVMSGGPGLGCAVRGSGELACWGTQGYDATTDEPRPMRTPSGRFTSVSVSEYNACALRTDGRAVCWGTDDEQARPAPRARMEVPPITAGAQIEATWTGAPLDASLTDFDVDYERREWGASDDPEATGESEPDWMPWLARTTMTTASLDATGGGTYCFRVRARDADGLVGPWNGGGCTSVPLDDRELTASPEWTAVEGDGFLHGTALRATMKGATIRITNGSPGSIGILATTCGGCGTFVVRSVSRECASGEGQESAAPGACPTSDEEVDLRGQRKDSILVFASDNGEESFAGPVDIIVTSSGKPVIIDGVLFNLETE